MLRLLRRGEAGANDVENDTYIHYLAGLRDRFDRADLDAETYDALRRRYTEPAETSYPTPVTT